MCKTYVKKLVFPTTVPNPHVKTPSMSTKKGSGNVAVFLYAEKNTMLGVESVRGILGYPGVSWGIHTLAHSLASSVAPISPHMF